MKIENSFRVDLPVAQAWATLLDIPSVVPCMPGAELLAVEDERTYSGQVKVKLGPVAVAFKGRARMVEIDEGSHTVRMSAAGTEARGRGSAQAEVVFHLFADGSGTRVDIVSDLSLAGAVAQYGRAQGVIADVSQVLVDTFAQNLSRHIAAGQGNAALPASDETGKAATTAAAPAISAFGVLKVLVRQWFSRFRGTGA